MAAVPSLVEKVLKVLVIDDDPSVLSAMSCLLTIEGFNVIEARDGLEGLARLRSEQPDVIFCDLEMPRMNGFEFCRTPDVQLARVPVVLVSGASGVERAAAELGVPFLRKPVRFEQLRSAIETYARF
jgi:CheY-like chemotaxis protein